ncbi:5'-nucleotidase C-terminal domain-containing protein [uncultured Gulosibacter sp.]|uniref:5'-nucleotidase C-terminal domain-containing protein n=1 Tax=uncultured Gulosibacter sp. TaxID=1339167 RepID=UPI0028892305|nr:5'-nucleotidase C-terminal domain-containing protein [uncultured Gulosibacter sp.]
MAHKKNFARGAVASVVGGLLAFAGLAVPAFADESLHNTEIISPAADLAEGQKQINIVSYNDFHGRLSNLEAFAGGSLAITDKFGAENTLFVANGDQVGASEFESSLQNDDPTIDALVALSEGSQHSFTVGNHEFDKGQEDTERIRQRLGGTLLGANVTKSDGSLLLDPYRIYEVNGVKVAVIGAVTDSTPSGVSPQGIQGLTFSDPVDAVNKYAEEIKQSDAADIIIASYHEGGPTTDLDTNLGNEVFSKMVKDTSNKVDLVLHGHTHYAYNYDITERRVLQAGEYGKQVGQIVFTLDADNKVVNTDSAVIDTIKDKAPIYTRDNLSSQSQQVYDKVVGIKSEAYAKAEELGAREIGVVNDDITRAYTWADGTAVKDDRAQASSLGVLVADSMHTWANDNTTGADLSIMNPGGLRADIEGDGVLTYKDAQTVLPFTNTLALVTLNGAQLKQVLEEQWQLDANGEVPSRPYLQLGISSNVSYTTDASRDRGDRITSVTIDGKPLDMNAQYTAVMPSFLAAGGDNFHTLAEGTMTDTGSIDLDAFVQYVDSLENNELKAPKVRPGVDTEGFFNGYGEGPTVKAGEDFTFTVKDFNLRSKGFTANETIEVKIGDKTVGTANVTGDTAKGETVSAEITLNALTEDLAGEQTVTLNFVESGAAAQLPITVETSTTPIDPTSTVTLDKRYAAAGDDLKITLTGFKPNAEVALAFHSTPVDLGTVTTDASGAATLDAKVPADATGGDHEVVATQDATKATAPLTISTLEVVPDKASSEESTAGFFITGAGWEPEVKVTVTIEGPENAREEFTVTPDAHGTFTEHITWATYDLESGNVTQNNQEFPVGGYTVTAVQGDVTVTTTFTVTDANGVVTAGGKNLAATGADGNLLVGGIAVALLVAAAGATLVVKRRNS